MADVASALCSGDRPRHGRGPWRQRQRSTEPMLNGYGVPGGLRRTARQPGQSRLSAHRRFQVCIACCNDKGTIPEKNGAL